MEDWDRWKRRCDGRAPLPAANDRGGAASADMEIVRSLGGGVIASLLRRDQDSKRRHLMRAAR